MRFSIFPAILATSIVLIVLGGEKPGEICVQRLVSPRYPPIARQARLQGSVQLDIKLDKDGVPSEVTLVGGPPILGRAASDAVRKWQFCGRGVESLNGQMLSIMVSFRLEGKKSDEWSITETRMLSPFNMEI